MGSLAFMRAEWRFLLYGLLMSFFSSLGQTFFISLFSPQIRETLDLSHGSFGSWYAAATIASAITLFWLGKLADTVSVPRLSFYTLTGLALAALFFASIQTVWMLVIGLYLLRLFGQGMSYHVYATAMARRYRAARGRALAISSLGIHIAESIGPASVVGLLAVLDWRLLWAGLAMFSWLALVPFLPVLTRRTELQDGLGRQSGADISAQQPASLSRREMLRDPVFRGVILWLVAMPSFVITGLFFHQIFLASERAVPLLVWGAHYGLYALAAVCGALAAGWLIDRFSAQHLAAFSQSGLVVAPLCLWLVPGAAGLWLFFSSFGLAAGMTGAMMNALLAERYGTEKLGEIRALILPVTVLFSAVSPMLMGVMIDAGAGLGLLMGLVALIAALPVSAAFVWFNLLGRRVYR